MPFSSESAGGAEPSARAGRATDGLAGCGFGPVRWVSETGSTNADLLAEAAAGAAHGLILAADHQRAGRGRRQRRWESAPGDALLASILLRPGLPPERMGVVTMALGVAAAEACADLGFVGVGLKWPNDLVVGPSGEQRKLAGILAQTVVVGPEVALVAGIGINVVGRSLGELAGMAIALDELGPPPDRVDLLVAVFSRFATWYAVAEANPAAVLARYRELSATLGRPVRVETDTTVIEGRALDVTDTGALIVHTATGPRQVVVGDLVSLRH